MSVPHFLFLMLICLVWGFTFVAGKAGVTEFPPIFFTGLRYVLLMAVLLPFLRWIPGQMRQIFLISLAMGSVHFALFYMGMASAEKVSSIAVVVQMSVPFSTLLSIWMLGETVRWRRWSGILIGFGGILVIGFDSAMLSERVGVMFTLGAAFSNALGMIWMKRLRDVGVYTLQAWIALMSWPLLFAVSALVESGQVASLGAASWTGWGGVIYTALGASLIGHAGIYYLVQRYDVSFISPFTLLAPIFGILFGVTVWGDALSTRFMMGASLTLLGV
ncbi:MAG: DMT family transporter, partial [Hyphomicrobiales bacterium]|nr:DMT family transporter [Hyphomicrobiales bacterium]